MLDTEAPYQLLFENNSSPIIGFDRETFDILTVNDAAVRQYGYSRQEFLTMTIDDIHPSIEVTGMIERCALPGKDCKLDPVRAGVYKHRKKGDAHGSGPYLLSHAVQRAGGHLSVCR